MLASISVGLLTPNWQLVIFEGSIKMGLITGRRRMQSLGNIDELRVAAAYFSLRSSVRKTSFAPFLLTAILLIASMDLAGWKNLLLGAAVAMAIYAIWVVVTASPLALITNGIILTVGGFGLSVGVAWSLFHGSHSARGIFFGIAGGLWGLSSLNRYKQFKFAIAAMNPAARARVEELVQSVKRAKVADDFELIEMIQDDKYKLKVRLMNDGVVMVQGSDIAILSKIEFGMTRRAPAKMDGKPEKRVKINLLLRGGSVNASITSDCVQRYENWKGATLGMAAGA
jgi:hypothetical protein